MPNWPVFCETWFTLAERWFADRTEHAAAAFIFAQRRDGDVKMSNSAGEIKGCTSPPRNPRVAIQQVFFGPKTRPKYRPKKWLEVPFENDTCMNFLFWTFWAAFHTISNNEVPILFQ